MYVASRGNRLSLSLNRARFVVIIQLCIRLAEYPRSRILKWICLQKSNTTLTIMGELILLLLILHVEKLMYLFSE